MVYQVFPRSFVDTNGDGIGDIAGIISKLDYLVDLGIDVLWISPVYRSTQVDSGYDITDYKDVDPIFGTLSDLESLISQANARGIKIMLDIAVNHTSDEHPWFIESRSSKDNPRRDWYWWYPPREGKIFGEPDAEPTNWKTGLYGSAWKYDARTNEYFLHSFSERQPDLNWENPTVRSAIHEIVRWWIDKGVEGFRLDVINFISKRLPLQDSEPGDQNNGEPGFEAGMNGPRLQEFLREARREIAPGAEHILTVGEMPMVTVDQARAYTNPASREIDMVFQIEHLQSDRGAGKHDLHKLKLPKLRSAIARWQNGLNGIGWNSLYWSSHDHPRIVSRFGNDAKYRVESAKMLGTVLHMLKGTPYIYQGEELGMTNFPFTRLDQFQDIETQKYIESATKRQDYDASELLTALGKSSRANARTPMQWDDSINAGFTSGIPWMPVNPNAGTVNAKQAVADDDSVFHYYRKLIQLRHELPIIVHGRFDLLLEEHERVFAYTRSLENEQLLVLANVGDDPIEVPLDDAGTWATMNLLIGNYASGEQRDGIMLRPWETRVYHRK